MRNLPEKNPLLGKPKKSTLLKQCKPYKIRFENNVYIDFVTLPVQVPSKDTPIFLVRMKHKQDYISATAMFRAAFPYATDEEERMEFDNYIMKYISSATSNEYTSGIWIMFDDALSLSDDYGIKTWIKVLMNVPIERSSEDAASPSKQLSATTFKKYIQFSTGHKYRSLTIASNNNTNLSFETLPQNSHTKQQTSPQKITSQPTEKKPLDPYLKSTETTTLSFSSIPNLSTPRNSKKRPLELCGPNDFIPIKRSKIEQLETEVVIERRRVKALFALVLSLGISVTFPYIL